LSPFASKRNTYPICWIPQTGGNSHWDSSHALVFPADADRALLLEETMKRLQSTDDLPESFRSDQKR
jgi:hypothetical protein